MPAPFPRPLRAHPGRPKLAVARAVVGIAVALALLVVAATCSASAIVVELFAAVAVVIALGCATQFPAAVRRIRNDQRARKSTEVAELRRELAALPETPHPLGL
jgi:hypothetical protein